MTRYDEVRYHDEICVVEEVLDDEPDHLIAVRPYHADGVFVIHESDCERVADPYVGHFAHCYIREGDLCSCGGAR